MREPFKQGLMSRSIGPLLIAGVFFVLLLISSTAYLNKSFFDDVPFESMLHERADGATLAAYRINRFNRNPVKNAVFLLGSSGLKEGFQSEEELNQRDTRFKFIKLATSGQNLAETIRFVDALTPQGQTLVVGINYIRLYHNRDSFLREHKKLSLVPFSFALSSFLNKSEGALIKALPLSGFLFHMRLFFSERRSRGLKYGPLDFKYHLYDDLPRLSEKQHIENEGRLVTDYHKNFFENHEFNFKALDFLIQLAAEKKMKLVLLELPMNPRVLITNAKVLELYSEKINAFVKERGVAYWNFSQTIGLGPEHFYDFTHLNPAGRLIYQSEAIKRLED